MKKPVVGVSSGTQPTAEYVPSKSLKLFPHLDAFLLNDSWEDGDAKGSRAQMVFVETGAVRILFKVESPALKFSVVGRTYDDALMAAELVLKTGQVVWEPDSRPQTTPRKKSK